MEWNDNHLNEESSERSPEDSPFYVHRENYNEEQKGDQPEIFVHVSFIFRHRGISMKERLTSMSMK